MSVDKGIESHWAQGDVYALVLSALQKAGKSLDGLTVEDLAPIDHFHARGLASTVDLADCLPIRPGDHVLDIGCGLGGPARYFAKRFGCRVSGVDITGPFVDAANKLTDLVGMTGQVSTRKGDALHLPYDDETFDAAYSQHVTMNIPDRPRFFAEAFRVLKPGAHFGLTEHGLGPAGSPYHPVPWSEDGTGEWLATPEQTEQGLAGAGFVDIEIEHTGPKYAAAYQTVTAAAERGELPSLGVHLLLGGNALEKTRNSKRNIEEERTQPVQVICRKPG